MKISSISGLTYPVRELDRTAQFHDPPIGATVTIAGCRTWQPAGEFPEERWRMLRGRS